MSCKKLRAMIEDQSPKAIAKFEIPSGFSVFCDMDGTLIDTDYANYLAYRRAVKEVTGGTHDVEFSDERLNREGLKKRLPTLTPTQLEVIATLKTSYFNDFLSETRLNAELAHLITKHRNRNKLVIVSNCRKMRVVQVLKHHELLECFDQLICWEALPHGESSNKYKIAISLTKVDPHAVIVYENEKTEAERAAFAGIPPNNILSFQQIDEPS